MRAVSFGVVVMIVVVVIVVAVAVVIVSVALVAEVGVIVALVDVVIVIVIVVVVAVAVAVAMIAIGCVVMVPVAHEYVDGRRPDPVLRRLAHPVLDVEVRLDRREHLRVRTDGDQRGEDHVPAGAGATVERERLHTPRWVSNREKPCGRRR